MTGTESLPLTRRSLTAAAACSTVMDQDGHGQTASADAGPGRDLLLVSLRVNGVVHALQLDPRTTLLDSLREHMWFTGTKKACDHGQRGACTVLVEGRRIYSCLTLALMHEGEAVTTIKGLGRPGALRPMQAASIKHDGYQCGYCTPGQICASVAALEEIAAGLPSHVTADLMAPLRTTPAELREWMSGNICRCGAYANILDAIAEVVGRAP